VGYTAIKEMQRSSSMVRGLGATQNDGTTIPDCEACSMTKSHATPSRALKEERARSRPGMALHMDTAKYGAASKGGARHFLSIIDESSRKSWVQFTKSKEAPEVMQQALAIINLVEREQERKVEVLHMDDGREFLKLRDHAAQQGIKTEVSAAYAKEQNGLVERLNRTLRERTRACLKASGFDVKFWAEAMTFVNLARNSTYCTPIKKTPEEAYSGIVPDVSYFRPFGALCYAHIDGGLRTKQEDTARKVHLMGFRASNIFRVYDPSTGRFLHRRDVNFPRELQYQIAREQEPSSEIESTPAPAAAAAATTATAAAVTGASELRNTGTSELRTTV
jgi:transposase InsO family protein